MAAETEIEQHRTARHLDDPTPILGGLSLLQLFGVSAASFLSYELWGYTAFLGGRESPVLYEIRVIFTACVWFLLAGAAYLQFRGKTEPFVVQLIAFLFRPHRYRAARLERERYVEERYVYLEEGL